jgi:putative endonuclease
LPFTALLKFIGETFDRSARVPVPPFQTPSQAGSYGERVAASFLRSRGYQILYRNFLTREGEIDLVCREGEVLAFVEVRSRASIDFGRPAETVGPAKENALRQAAARYLQLLNRTDVFYRFDVVEVMLVPGEAPRCELHQDWFS